MNISSERSIEIGLTGSQKGQEILLKCSDLIASLGLLAEDKDPTVSKDSLLCLVNLSADDAGAKILVKSVGWNEFVKLLIKSKLIWIYFY